MIIVTLLTNLPSFGKYDTLGVLLFEILQQYIRALADLFVIVKYTNKPFLVPLPGKELVKSFINVL